MWMASGFVTYYATFGLFATYLQKDLDMSAAAVGWPLVFANIATFVSAFLWGGPCRSVRSPLGHDHPRYHRLVRHAAVSDEHRLHDDRDRVLDLGRIRRLHVYPDPQLHERALSDRSAGHGARPSATIRGHLRRTAPLALTWFAVDRGLGFAVPMMVCACGAIICYIASLLAWPDTKGQEMVADLQLLPAAHGDD